MHGKPILKSSARIYSSLGVFLAAFNLSSITASLPCMESTGQGSTELAPTRRKQMANVEVKMEDVTLFRWVALTNIAEYVPVGGLGVVGPG